MVKLITSDSDVCLGCDVVEAEDFGKQKNGARQPRHIPGRGLRAYEKLRRELRAGVYALLTLKVLAEEGPIHGYGLRAKIEEISNGWLRPSEGTIYEMLKVLEGKGLVRSYWAVVRGRARKLYEVTEVGSTVYRMMMGEVMLLRRLLDYLIGGGDDA